MNPTDLPSAAPAGPVATPSGPPNVRRRPGPRRWRRVLPYLGAVLVLAGIVRGLWPEPVRVETARVTAGPLRVTVNEEGKTRIRQRYVVSAPVTGHVRRLPLKAGGVVEAGRTVLAVIDPLTPGLLDARSRSLAEARRDTAAANLEKARAAHNFAESELRRFEKLAKEQTISPQELEAAQWRAVSATREAAAAESALRLAESELAEFATAADRSTNSVRAPCEVTSPTSGRVLRVYQESSRAVTAGTPLVEVGDPTDLEVVIEVLSRDAAALAPDTPVELEQWGGAEPLKAKVRLVEPAAFTKVSALGVEEQRVNVIADLVSPPAQRGNLGDAFRVEARIIVWETNRTLKLPAGALFRTGTNWAAFRIAEGRAHLQSVDVGRTSGTETEVKGGLADGDPVIVYPGDRIKDGQPVRPVTIDLP